MQKMSMAKELISPRRAAEYLKRNVNNRPLRRGRWKKLADVITSGAWMVNGESIKFNGNGDLIDGQHRLMACIETGESIETYVMRGLPHEAFDTLDQQSKRSIADVFSRQGHKHAAILAAAARWTFWYQKKGEGYTGGIQPHEANAVLAENPKLHEAADLSRRLYGFDSLCAPGTIAFLIHECGRAQPAKSVEFWTQVMSGEGLSKDTAAFTLRRRLIANVRSTASLPSEAVCAICIKAWNAFVAGRKLSQLKWADGEQFPQIIYK